MTTIHEAWAFIGCQWLGHGLGGLQPLAPLKRVEHVLCEDGATVMIYTELADGFLAAASYDAPPGAPLPRPWSRAA